MPTTLGDITEDLALDLFNRSDAVRSRFAPKNVLRAYLSICGLVPFPELETSSSAITPTQDVATVDLSTLDPPLAGIASIRYTDSTGGSTASRRLERRHVRQYDAQSVITSSRPYSYGRWGLAIELNPPPSSASDSMVVRYWAMPQVTRDTAANHTVLVPAEWEELIYWMAAERTYYHLGQFQNAMSLVAPMPMARMPATRKLYSTELGLIPRLLNDLLKTIPEREHVDEDYSINPIYRRYTHTRSR